MIITRRYRPGGRTYLRVTDQLHSTALVGSEASHLTDHAAHRLHALAGDRLLADGPGGEDAAVGRVTAVNTPNEVYSMLVLSVSR